MGPTSLGEDGLCYSIAGDLIDVREGQGLCDLRGNRVQSRYDSSGR